MRFSLVLLLVFWPPYQTITKDKPCTIELTAMDRHAWTLILGELIVQGDNTKLTQKDDVLYGFLNGEPTRLTMSAERLVGRIGEQEASYHLERSGDHLLLRGHLAGIQSYARASSQALILSSKKHSVHLHRSKNLDQWVFVDKTGFVKIALRRCSIASFLERPVTLLLVNYLLHSSNLPIGPQ